jgi:hypothetical protein
VIYWVTVNGTNMKMGYGDPAVNAPVTGVIGGTGPSLTASERGYIFRREPSNPAIEIAGEGVFSKLDRELSEAEITALYTGTGTPRQEMIAKLKAEVALGNVGWWPAPAIGKIDAQILSVTADVSDVSGVAGVDMVTAVPGRLTAEGP